MSRKIECCLFPTNSDDISIEIVFIIRDRIFITAKMFRNKTKLAEPKNFVLTQTLYRCMDSCHFDTKPMKFSFHSPKKNIANNIREKRKSEEKWQIAIQNFYFLAYSSQCHFEGCHIHIPISNRSDNIQL